MHFFVTGASGFIEEAVIEDLISHGHQVNGLVRSQEKAALIQSLGAEALLDDLEDPAVLKAGAANSDAVLHLDFAHYSFDISDLAHACKIDREAIQSVEKASKAPANC